MYALTVKQPFASAIIAGAKSLENRSWRPPARILGERIAIHAGSARHPLWRSVLPLWDGEQPFGALLGTVRVVGVVDHSDSPWWIGPLAWVLEDPIALASPIVMPGRLGLWRVPDTLCGAGS